MVKNERQHSWPCVNTGGSGHVSDRMPTCLILEYTSRCYYDQLQLRDQPILNVVEKLPILELLEASDRLHQKLPVTLDFDPVLIYSSVSVNVTPHFFESDKDYGLAI
jgi:hypothetical protein